MSSTSAPIASLPLVVGIGVAVLSSSVGEELDGRRPVSVPVTAPAVLSPALFLSLPTPHARWVGRYGGKIQLEIVRVSVFHRHRGPYPDVRPLALKVGQRLRLRVRDKSDSETDRKPKFKICK